ncbi:hypothetical protein EG68_05869 [Paragonimus skrjabini miyazakii]|uniref:Cationic amino acid transporter C-terminal domain-containing protein n=1 Tax=Paragonimus skrjabini miyazakii TaxID=59628 RepID=A0A8S9YMT4_9TREM|nr:hypothetical protein EG68_05869 [Paragonimus skrjabini miyazakii]
MKYKKITCSEFGRRLMRTRAATADSKMDTPLKRSLNAPQLTLYCIAHMIGAGLYVLTGKLIRDYAGAATALAYFVSAIAAIFTALCYAEFATLFPRAGSAYVYTYLMFGELPAFLIGWTMLSDVIVSTAAISKAFSGTVNLLTNNTIGRWSEQHLVNLGPSSVADSSPDLVAAAFLLVLMLFTLSGASISLTVNAILSSIQLLSLIVITVACFVLGNPNNFTQQGGFFPFGIGGLLRGAGLAVFGFSGFEAIANASEEAKNPRRDLPLALFSALFICAILYVSASLGLAYIVPRTDIVYESPFVAAFSFVGQKEMMGFAAFATLLATGATKLVTMYVIPRLFYSIASDGLLFGFMAYVERFTQVPIWGLFIGGLITILLATFVKIQVLAEFTSVGLIFSYFVIGMDLMILRYIYGNKNVHISDTSYNDTNDQDGITSTNSVDDHTTLVPTPTGLRLRSGTPNCLRMLESISCFNAILFAFILAVLVIGIIINVNVHFQITWLWIFLGVLCGILVLLFILLCFYRPMEGLDRFQTPFMPLAPCMTMMTNGILITSMEPLTWLRFAIWSAIGLIIYFAYGMWYSKADEVVDAIAADPTKSVESLRLASDLKRKIATPEEMVSQ